MQLEIFIHSNFIFILWNFCLFDLIYCILLLYECVENPQTLHCSCNTCSSKCPFRIACNIYKLDMGERKAHRALSDYWTPPPPPPSPPPPEPPPPQLEIKVHFSHPLWWYEVYMLGKLWYHWIKSNILHGPTKIYFYSSHFGFVFLFWMYLYVWRLQESFPEMYPGGSEICMF